MDELKALEAIKGFLYIFTIPFRILITAGVIIFFVGLYPIGMVFHNFAGGDQWLREGAEIIKRVWE